MENHEFHRLSSLTKGSNITTDLSTDAFQDYKYITTVYIINVIYVSLVKSLERICVYVLCL